MRGLRGVIGLTLGACVLVAAAPASARKPSPYGSWRYKVILATHRSQASFDDPPFYKGTSSSSWHLVRASRDGSNVVDISRTRQFLIGGGSINVSGVWQAEATTNNPNGHCTISAPTGSTEYGFVAPGPFQIAFGQDDKRKANMAVAIGFGQAVYASINNPYFGTECTGNPPDKPTTDQKYLTSLPKKLVGRKLITVRYAGSVGDTGYVYNWSTTIKLKLVKRLKR